MVRLAAVSLVGVFGKPIGSELHEALSPQPINPVRGACYRQRGIDRPRILAQLGLIVPQRGEGISVFPAEVVEVVHQ